MRDKKQKKIEKCQKKIEKFAKKLQKYRDMLTELTTDDTGVDVPETKPAAAPAEPKAARPVRKRRTSTAKTATVEKKPAVKRTGTAKAAAKAQTPKKETAAGKPKAAPRPGRLKDVDVFALFNCDEEKTRESMYNRNDETFRNTQLGRRGLWAKLKTEILEGRIELLDGYPIRNMRLDIESGNIETASAHLKYGIIEKVSK